MAFPPLPVQFAEAIGRVFTTAAIDFAAPFLPWLGRPSPLQPLVVHPAHAHRGTWHAGRAVTLEDGACTLLHVGTPCRCRPRPRQLPLRGATTLFGYYYDIQPEGENVPLSPTATTIYS